MKSIFNELDLKDGNGLPLNMFETYQKMFDKASEKEVTLYQKMYMDEWFETDPIQINLTAEGLSEKSNVRFMATLIGDEAPTPLMRSDGFDIWKGEIPRTGLKFVMPAKLYRKLIEITENPRLSDAQKAKYVKNELDKHMKNAYLGCKDTQDYIILQALSNFGIAKFTPELNNPGGRKYEVDYSMDERNKLVSVFNWTDENIAAGKVRPIEMLSAICSDMSDRGITPGEVLVSSKMFYWLLRSPETKLLVNGDDKKASPVAIEAFQNYLQSLGIPRITPIRRKVAIDSDGNRVDLNAWNDSIIAIKPEGKIGSIQPAVEDNELMPEKDVDYINAGDGIRIAKWRTGETSGQQAAEYTQGSWRAIPKITSINQIINIQVRDIKEKTSLNKTEAGFVTLSEFNQAK